MSPADHFADLKRAIQAIGGTAHRVNVIMPILYGGRQHRRAARESLDCAVALQELQNMGVSEMVTFDAHDPRVQNAIPLMGFDNAIPSYQTLKALLKHIPDILLDKDNFMVVSSYLNFELLFYTLASSFHDICSDNIICRDDLILYNTAHNSRRHISSADKP